MTQDDPTVGGSGRSSEEIRENIERTRSEMDTTVDEIESRLTPGQLFEEVWNMVRGRSKEGAKQGPGLASRVIREHPLPAAVTGLGLGWLAVESMSGSSEERRHPTSLGREARARRYRPRTGASYPGRYEPGRYEPADSVEGRAADEEDDGGMMDTVKEKAHEAKELVSGAKEKVSRTTARAGEGMEHLGEGARERAHEVREKTEELASSVRRGGRRARQGVARAMDENPLSMGFAAFAAGLVGGLSVPTTRWEDETMGEASDTLVDQAKETGRETMREAKHVAVAAAEEAVHRVEEEELTPGRMAESAREVVRGAKEAAREEAEREGLTPEGVKERLTGGGGGEKPGRGEGGEGAGSRKPGSEAPRSTRRGGEPGRGESGSGGEGSGEKPRRGEGGGSGEGRPGGRGRGKPPSSR